MGYLLKDCVGDVEWFSTVLNRVNDGDIVIEPKVISKLIAARRRRTERLSPRQREVLRHMAEGRSNRGIAHALGVGERTVEKYVEQIFGLLDLHHDSDDNRRVLAVLAWLSTDGTDGRSVQP